MNIRTLAFLATSFVVACCSHNNPPPVEGVRIGTVTVALQTELSGRWNVWACRKIALPDEPICRSVGTMAGGESIPLPGIEYGSFDVEGASGQACETFTGRITVGGVVNYTTAPTRSHTCHHTLLMRAGEALSEDTVSSL